MGEMLVALSGTSEGARLAVVLALLAALMHAVFGALQKGRHDVWLTRGAIDFCYGLGALPIALFVVPWPEAHMWPIFCVMFLIHAIYKAMQGFAYQFGDYTVVYPVARGLGPLLTVLAATVVFSESYTAVQWSGVLLLSCAIFALSLVNLRDVSERSDGMAIALLFAVGSGVMVASYTAYDAYAIRATQDPLTFLAWFFLIDGLVLFPWIAWRRWAGMAARPSVGPLMLRGLIGGLVAYFSFGAVMLATRLDKVGEAAVLRETSPIFAALIGWFILRERVGVLRSGLMCLIALGAVFVVLGAGE